MQLTPTCEDNEQQRPDQLGVGSSLVHYVVGSFIGRNRRVTVIGSVTWGITGQKGQSEAQLQSQSVSLAHEASVRVAPRRRRPRCLQRLADVEMCPKPSARQVSNAASTVTANPVIQWNREVLKIVRTPGVQSPTIHSTWDFAILHASIYDAVNSITKRHQPYKINLAVAAGASEDAAAISAGHEALVNLYEDFRPELDSIQHALLAAIPDGKAKNEGVRIGRKVADSILALRAKTTAMTRRKPLFNVTGAPGTWQPMPPNFQQQPQFTQWGNVKLFVLSNALQFPLGPPPALTSQAFINAFNEVKRDGKLGGTALTADQTQIGKFWNGNIQDYWQEIAQTAAIGHNLNTEETARVFALLDLSLADDRHRVLLLEVPVLVFWRPVTAIREAGALHNPALVPDTTWLPLVTKTTARSVVPRRCTRSKGRGPRPKILMNFFATNDFLVRRHAQRLCQG